MSLDIWVHAAGLTCLVLAPVIIFMCLVARIISLQLHWLLQVHVQAAGYIWTRLVMRVCSMFQLHVQATVSRGAHVYHGSCTHVFDCHRWGQCGSIECAHFCPSLGLKSSIKYSNFEPQFVFAYISNQTKITSKKAGGIAPRYSKSVGGRRSRLVLM